MSLRHKRCWHFALRFCLLGAITAVLVQAVFAQEGTICGMVQDQTRALVADAAVELRNSDTRRDAKTGSAGNFCFDRVSPGVYELTVQANGVRTHRQKNRVDSTEPSNLTIFSP